jgi:hypothetical protein
MLSNQTRNVSAGMTSNKLSRRLLQKVSGLLVVWVIKNLIQGIYSQRQSSAKKMFKYLKKTEIMKDRLVRVASG